MSAIAWVLVISALTFDGNIEVTPIQPFSDPLMCAMATEALQEKVGPPPATIVAFSFQCVPLFKNPNAAKLPAPEQTPDKNAF
jgi:hypothetical protein